MNSKVCVNCGNTKPVNGTSNRLVTESCGHVKCMQCLLQETSGCKACDASGSPEADVESAKKNKLNTSHIKVETDGDTKKYTCTICNKSYTSRSQTLYHAYCNGQKKPYQCTHPNCQDKNKGFASLSHFKYHMRIHSGERQYKCEVCSEGFVLKSKLQRHKLTHTKDKKYQCHECGRAFNNRSALRKHMRQHSGEAPYSCQVCGKNFNDSSNFRKHLQRHDSGLITSKDLRRFKCQHCQQSFNHLKDLKRHSFIHLDSKLWGCTKCTSAFRRKDNLKRHLRNAPLKHSDSQPAESQGGTSVNGPSNGIETKTANGTLTPIIKPPIVPTIKPAQTLTADEKSEKAKLEVLNPLPPLSKEVIQKHLYDKGKEKEDVKIDNSYIIQANNARQSVITKVEPKNEVPVTEYVHKIRKANSLSCRKEVPLPPIDEAKFIALTSSSMNLDVGPLPKNIQTYKNILHDKSEKNGEEKVPEVHWRKKRLTDTE